MYYSGQLKSKFIAELFTVESNSYHLGEGGVLKIEEYRPARIGDKWFYDVYYESGIVHREFNPDTVIYDEKED